MAAAHPTPEPSLHHRLRGGIRFCVCSGRTVFLDLPADRYFCLPSPIEHDFQSWLARRHPSLPALERLVEIGILVASQHEGVAPCPAALALPMRDLSAQARTNIGLIVWAVVEQLIARFRLRRTPFAALVMAMEKEAATSRSIDGERATHAMIAAAFAGSRLIMHSHDNCLSQSIAFHRACRRMKLDAAFVIGVRLDPFSAHCWVQCGDLVLNDSVERVQHFTPIVVA